MSLTQNEIQVFYKLWFALLWGINEKYEIIPHFENPKENNVSVQNDLIKIRNTMWDHPEWIDEFLLEGGDDEITIEERDIIIHWRKNFLKGEFVVMKHFSQSSDLMMVRDESVYVYNVLGISEPLKDTIPYRLPVTLKVVLLPWGDKIIYDSILEPLNIPYGKELHSKMKEWYQQSKEKYGVIKKLGDGKPLKHLLQNQKGSPVKTAKSTENVSDHTKIPKAMKEVYDTIAGIITQFSDEKLNDEYKELALKALAKLCRKRPSPLLKGRPKTWACGIIYAIGSNNFIFDKSQEIHMTAIEIAEWFGLSKSTAGSKASEINKILRISYTNIEYVLKDIIDTNPMFWLLEVNGYVMDIRYAPYAIQKEAYELGYIPYIPADQNE